MIKKEILKTIVKLFDKFLNTEFHLRLVSENSEKFYKNSYDVKEYDLIFIHIPKTGGTTFNFVLDELKKKENIKIKQRGHFSISIKTLSSNEKTNYCTVIRDPIERSISWYNRCLGDKNYYSHGLAKKGFDVFMRRCSEVHNTFCKYYSGYLDQEVNEYTMNIALNNLKNFKYVFSFENLENELKNFANNHNLNLSTIPKFDYNSKKTDYENLEYKNIAKFYNPYDMMLYNAAQKEIFNLNK
tara:strand:+ start:86 stop:811 length:726 start_codon:yes stop_codon:yes gene_type:complete